GTGVPVEQSAKEPSGEHAGCVSAFGVRDMHGGAWEWTSSAWGRGSPDPELGVLRGGDAAAGEVGGRCADGIARGAGAEGVTLGFRCCAGPVNEAWVDLRLVQAAPLEKSASPAELAAPLARLAKSAWLAKPGASIRRAWLWHPVANEELVIAGGCGRAGA